MSFDLYAYASHYSGRIQLDRLGFILNKYNPDRLPVVKVLENCVQRFSNPDILMRKYTSSEMADENEIASGISSEFYRKNEPINQMRMTFELGLDKLAWRSADAVQKDLASNRTISTQERFGMLLEASLVNLVFESSNNSASAPQLRDCEIILDAASSSMSGKNQGSMNDSGEDKNVFYPTPSDILRCRLMRALTSILNSNASECANTLLHVPQSCIDVPNEKINDIATISDMVMYVVLCSLATMDREGLRRNVIENTNFREWLESPGCEDCKVLLDSFFHCKWNSAWKLLDAVCNKAKYDMFINRLVSSLRQTIRNKMLLQYCRPFASVSIPQMSEAFNESMMVIEQMILVLIDKGRLSARIDGIKHEIIRYTPDPRVDAYEHTLTAGKAFEDWTDRDVFYTNIVDGGFLNSVVPELDAKQVLAALEKHSRGETSAARDLYQQDDSLNLYDSRARQYNYARQPDRRQKERKEKFSLHFW